MAVIPISVAGRLPGEFFREDNPPRFGALMSFVSTSDSVVVLHVNSVKPNYTIAKQLAKIAQGFKIRTSELQKTALLEGKLRWLQYTFHKKKGGGFIYVTRHENWIAYLVVFNLHYDALAIDLPYIDRYINQIELTLN